MGKQEFGKPGFIAQSVIGFDPRWHLLSGRAAFSAFAA
jgi:hypothetical protein